LFTARAALWLGDVSAGLKLLAWQPGYSVFRSPSTKAVESSRLPTVHCPMRIKTESSVSSSGLRSPSC
jgi:hypothetical protein